MICWGSQMVAMDWITFVTVIIVGNSVACAAVAVNSTDHVCFREETVTELIRVPVQQEVKVRSSSWCLEIPPRCSNYKTEMREVIKLQVGLIDWNCLYSGVTTKLIKTDTYSVTEVYTEHQLNYLYIKDIL